MEAGVTRTHGIAIGMLFFVGVLLHPTDIPPNVRHTVQSQPSLEQSVPHFLGVAERRRNRNEEQAYALLHAAQQAARYEETVARYASMTRENGDDFGRLDHVNVAWDESRERELWDELEVVDTIVHNTGTLVWASGESLAPVPVDRHAVAGGHSPPSWVFNTPSVDGVIVGVGLTQRRRTLKATVDAADAEALMEILRVYELGVIADQQMLDRDQGRVEERRSRRETTQAVLEGFHVIDRYFTESGQYLYSLGIAVVGDR
ncbi:MAG: hypothetical protein ACOCRN_04110 [Spirochaetia bacterium]